MCKGTEDIELHVREVSMHVEARDENHLNVQSIRYPAHVSFLATVPTWKGQKIFIAYVSFLAIVPTWKSQKISIKVNECPCLLPSPPPSSSPPVSPIPVPPSSPPLISTPLPSPSSPNGSQPPYVQVTNPASSPVHF
ncbi:hypothetical protein ACFX16_038159 [Malus domestica]